MKRALLILATALLSALPLVLTGGSAHAADGRSSDVRRLLDAGIDVLQLRPGWVIDDGEIVWDGGATRLTIEPLAPVVSGSWTQSLTSAFFPRDEVAAAAATPSCTSGYVCLYDGSNYGGRRLELQSAGLRGDMSDYTFNDKMSSWYSRRSLDARWYYNKNGSGTSRCMESGNRNANVGAGASNFDNDELSSFRIYADDGRC